jgi:hypothetical protein
MAYTESELVQLVAAKIDEILPPGENVPSGALIEAPIPYIEKELKEAGYHILRQAPIIQVKQVIKKAATHFPAGMTDPETPTPNPNVRVISSDTAGAYLVPCPTDFLRFLNIKLSTWSVPVSELIPEEDPKYREQKTIKWTRGTELKPKAALVSFSDYVAGEINSNFPNIGLAVECFSSKTLPTLSAFHYVPKVSPTSMPEDLVDAMIWECAGRTLLIMNQAQRAATAFAQVQRYFANKYGVIGE